MRVAVLYGEVPPDAPADEQDVLVEAGAVSEALSGLRHEVSALQVSLDLARLARDISETPPDIAFNLVESLGGRGSLIHLCPAVLDSLGVPYTGSPTEAVFTTSSKLLTKRALKDSGIPTPGWVGEGGHGFVPGAHYIIKSVWEHASIGLESDSVAVFGSPEGLLEELERRRPLLGGACFAEEFIDGREFNISLIETDAGPEVLPPAEIRFVDLPEGSRRMVGYRAKWVEDSDEYKGTRRSFIFPETDGELLTELADISRECWRLFGLAGYARVDFRVDSEGRPWVLEVNVNPCISPDAGFVAAAGMAGMGYGRLVGRILDAAVTGRRKAGVTA